VVFVISVRVLFTKRLSLQRSPLFLGNCGSLLDAQQELFIKSKIIKPRDFITGLYCLKRGN
ncbi:hypothetical protein KAR48_14065, partial [bacterium]|nr:hypothetical protein [bacterium]